MQVEVNARTQVLLQKKHTILFLINIIDGKLLTLAQNSL